MGAGAVTAKNPAIQKKILAKKKAKKVEPVVPKPHQAGGDVDGNQDQSTVRPEHEVRHDASTDGMQLDTVEEE